MIKAHKTHVTQSKSFTSLLSSKIQGQIHSIRAAIAVAILGTFTHTHAHTTYTRQSVNKKKRIHRERERKKLRERGDRESTVGAR